MLLLTLVTSYLHSRADPRRTYNILYTAETVAFDLQLPIIIRLGLPTSLKETTSVLIAVSSSLDTDDGSGVRELQLWIPLER